MAGDGREKRKKRRGARSPWIMVDLGGDAPEGAGAPDPSTFNELAGALETSAAWVEGRRAGAELENLKSEAPCHGCGRIMPASERCGGCRANGVWYCTACHARFEGIIGG